MQPDPVKYINKTPNLGCVNRKSEFERVDSDHLVHVQSIIQDFALHSYMLQYPMILLVDSESPDRLLRCTGWSGPLLSACIVRPI